MSCVNNEADDIAFEKFHMHVTLFLHLGLWETDAIVLFSFEYADPKAKRTFPFLGRHTLNYSQWCDYSLLSVVVHPLYQIGESTTVWFKFLVLGIRLVTASCSPHSEITCTAVSFVGSLQVNYWRSKRTEVIYIYFKICLQSICLYLFISVRRKLPI